jgi:dethiobiotin synthetase
MSKGYFITGIDTGIGKTRAALAIMAALQQRGLCVCGMKPVSAGCTLTEEGLVNEDALALKAQSSLAIPYQTVNPYAWLAPIAPHIAAAQTGSEMTLPPINKAYQTIAAQCDKVIVEGAGGWLVPLNTQQSMADIVADLSLDVILVVGIRLGCLNHALLTAESIRQKGCRLTGWIANHLSEQNKVAQENETYLTSHIDAPLLGSFAYEAEATAAQLSRALAVEYLLN